MARFMNEHRLPMLGTDKYYEIWSFMSSAESASTLQQQQQQQVVEKGEPTTTPMNDKLQSSQDTVEQLAFDQKTNTL